MTVVEEYKFGIPLAELPSYRTDPLVGDKPVEKRDGIDYKLLDEMISYIEAHPRTWNQQSWFSTVDTNTGEKKYITKIQTVEEINSCGSSFCLAGHVALRKGFPAPPIDNDQEWVRAVKGQDWEEDVETFALNVLGITDVQANQLFDAENDLMTLKRMVFTLKVDPEIPGYELSRVRYMDDVEFIDFINGYIPTGEY